MIYMDTYAILTTAALAIYGLATVLYGLLWLRSNALTRRVPVLLMAAGVLANTAFLLLRWQEAGRPPFKTLFETMTLLAGCIALVYLIMEIVYSIRAIGILAALGCTISMAYAWWIMDKEIINIPPALQSAWFVPHVVIYFFGYAAVFLTFVAAVVFLVHPKPISHKRPDLMGVKVIDMEDFSVGTMRFGFALLTTGLLMGAFWAKSAWGDYWGWDPKETWSLVSWLIFVIILHLRYFKKWRGRRYAILIIIGFVAVMFTYLGMNVLPSADSSLHVYQ